MRSAIVLRSGRLAGMTIARTLGVAQATSSREQAIDATRGTAMLFVCLSHFAFAYFGEGPTPHALQASLAFRISLLASPTFVVVSGLMFGFLSRVNPMGLPALSNKLVDRGLFLLTIGHVLIALAHAPVAGGLARAFTWGFVTDPIGVGLIVGPWLVRRVSSWRRLGVAAGAYFLSWAVAVLWAPSIPTLERAKEYLFGPANFLPDRGRLVVECFPVLPWLAIYIAATVLGEHVGRHYAEGHRAAARALITRVALASLVCAATIKAGPYLLTLWGVMAPNVLVWTLGWPFQKQPPAPAYLGLYGGVGLLLLRLLMAVEEGARGRRWLMAPAMLGRVSLAVFIAQFYLYFVLLKLWAPRYSPLWPLLFLASLGITGIVGVIWNRRAWNDVFTVGYPRFAVRKSVISGVATGLSANPPRDSRARSGRPGG